MLEDSLVRGELIEQTQGESAEIREQISGQLAAGFWLRKKGGSLNPRPGFIDSSKAYVVSRILTTDGVLDVGGQISRKSPRLSIQFITLIVVIVVIFLGGFISAAGMSLPGDPLYELRTMGENLVVILVINPEHRAQLHWTYAQEHLVDCAKVVSLGRREDAQKAFINFERHMVGMSRVVNKISSENGSLSNLNVHDVSRMYLEGMMIFRVLVPEAF